MNSNFKILISDVIVLNWVAFFWKWFACMFGEYQQPLPREDQLNTLRGSLLFVGTSVKFLFLIAVTRLMLQLNRTSLCIDTQVDPFSSLLSNFLFQSWFWILVIYFCFVHFCMYVLLICGWWKVLRYSKMIYATSYKPSYAS